MKNCHCICLITDFISAQFFCPFCIILFLKFIFIFPYLGLLGIILICDQQKNSQETKIVQIFVSRLLEFVWHINCPTRFIDHYNIFTFH